MKILLVIVISIVAVVLYAAFRLWLFFRRIVKPNTANFSSKSDVRNSSNPVENQKLEVIYSNNEVVVLKGEAKNNKDSKDKKLI